MLLLRQLMEPVFMETGLSDLYIDRSNSTYNIGGIYVCGPCGQQFITIPGINVEKKMTSAEREYAFELVRRFITEKADDIDEIWTIKKSRINFNKLHPIYHCSKPGGKNGDIRLNDKETGCSVYYKEDSKELCYNFNDTEREAIELSLSREDEYLVAMRVYKEAFDKDAEMSSRLGKLTTCTIT